MSELAVLTAHQGRNDVMIASAARLYIPDGAIVLDCTWGRGNFWKRTDTTRFRLVTSDIAQPAQFRADFRALPFRDACADVIVLDPPYIHAPGRRYFEGRYRNKETTPLKDHAAIMGLYQDGIGEATRVLRPGGLLLVKCQDTVESHRQRWSHITIHTMAEAAAMEALDLFVLLNPTPPGGTAARPQKHARRNHSYLWIMRCGS